METANLKITDEINDKMKSFCEAKRQLINAGLEKVGKDLVKTLCDSDTDDEKGFVEMHATLRQQVILKDFLGDLEEYLSAHVLFAYHTRKMDEQHSVAYVLSDELGTFVINIDSCQYGIVDELYITFYESIDTMFLDLKECLGDTVISCDKNSVMEESQSFTELWKIFFE